MLVCHCYALTNRDICLAVGAGATTVAQVVDRCGAGTACGGCQDAVAEIVASEKHRLAMLPSSGTAPGATQGDAPLARDPRALTG